MKILDAPTYTPLFSAILAFLRLAIAHAFAPPSPTTDQTLAGSRGMRATTLASSSPCRCVTLLPEHTPRTHAVCLYIRCDAYAAFPSAYLPSWRENTSSTTCPTRNTHPLAVPRSGILQPRLLVCLPARPSLAVADVAYTGRFQTPDRWASPIYRLFVITRYVVDRTPTSPHTP